jgi:hypothetical protein
VREQLLDWRLASLGEGRSFFSRDGAPMDKLDFWDPKGTWLLGGRRD